MGNAVITEEQRAASAAANRANMPEFSAFVDFVREIFGKGCRVRYAHENGFTLGRPDPGPWFPLWDEDREPGKLLEGAR